MAYWKNTYSVCKDLRSIPSNTLQSKRPDNRRTKARDNSYVS